MKPLSWRFLLLVALVALVPILILGDAEAARRSGLAGNLLIRDADDMFIYPQHNVTYVNRLIVDMGSSAGVGNGSLVFGEEDSWGLNFSTHRSDFLNGVVAGYWGGNDRGLFGPPPPGAALSFSPDLTGPSDPTQGPHDVQWFDVGFGWGSETPIGFRVGIGMDADALTIPPSPEIQNGANVFSIQGGASLNESTDLTAEISIGSSEADSLEGSVTQFAAGIRGFYEMADFEWGYLGALAYATDEADSTTAEKRENTITQFLAGWGPVWNDESEDWQVAGYVTLEFQKHELDLTGPAKVNERFITFPGFRFAGEHRLKSWLWVRGGVRSDYFFHKLESEAINAEGSNRIYDFQWTAGFSADWNSFRFDGAINEPWVHTGSFLGQQNEDLLAFASVTYNWGGAEAE
jgi:hypothetical protein